jgi:hypothetical protein
MSTTNVLNIRLVTPVDLTDEQGETAYYAALTALHEAIPELSDAERERITDESGFGLEELVRQPDGPSYGPDDQRPSSEACEIVHDGYDTNSDKWSRCEVHRFMVFGDSYICEGYEPPPYEEGSAT